MIFLEKAFVCGAQVLLPEKGHLLCLRELSSETGQDSAGSSGLEDIAHCCEPQAEGHGPQSGEEVLVQTVASKASGISERAGL